ncbi:hypothetical protein AB0L75_39690 [Streptomyces sp. NPDC052101]|uniref:hypothetical protein n=1 Tax=Streptomyces sp. NPDC052101 TaxID=3155763 RepID=UPI0034331FC5
MILKASDGRFSAKGISTGREHSHIGMMADATTLYSLISGIGGALIDGIAGVYGPGRIDKRRRLHELLLEGQRRQAEEQAAAREEKQRVLDAIAEAIVCTQDWHRLVSWAVQGLDAGREVDVAKFDEAAEPVLPAVVRAVSLLSNNSFRPTRLVRVTPSVDEHGDRRRPVTFSMHQVRLDLRRQILAPQPGFDGDSISMRAAEIRGDLMVAFMTEREARVGSSIPIGDDGVCGRPA